MARGSGPSAGRRALEIDREGEILHFFSPPTPARAPAHPCVCGCRAAWRKSDWRVRRPWPQAGERGCRCCASLRSASPGLRKAESPMRSSTTHDFPRLQPGGRDRCRAECVDPGPTSALASHWLWTACSSLVSWLARLLLLLHPARRLLGLSRPRLAPVHAAGADQAPSSPPAPSGPSAESRVVQAG